MRQQAEGRDDARRLMTHPGVGPQTALGMVLTVGQVNRFATSKQLASYLGLTPREHSSGGKQRLDTSANRYQLTRSCGGSGPDGGARRSQLQRAYRRLAAKKSRAVAKVMVARRLAVRLSGCFAMDGRMRSWHVTAGKPGSFRGEQ